MYKIFNKLCHPITLNHFTLTSKKRFNTMSNCDFIQPYFKYNYMNNTLRGRDTIDFFEKKLNFKFFFNVKL